MMLKIAFLLGIIGIVGCQYVRNPYQRARYIPNNSYRQYPIRRPIYPASYSCFDKHLDKWVNNGDVYKQTRFMDERKTFKGVYECTCKQNFLRCVAEDIPCKDEATGEWVESNGIFIKKFCTRPEEPYPCANPDVYECQCFRQRAKYGNCVTKTCSDFVTNRKVLSGEPFLRVLRNKTWAVCLCDGNELRDGSCRPLTEAEIRKVNFGRDPLEIFAGYSGVDNSAEEDVVPAEEDVAPPEDAADPDDDLARLSQTCWDEAENRSVGHGESFMKWDQGRTHKCNCEHGVHVGCTPHRYCTLKANNKMIAQNGAMVYKRTATVHYNCTCTRRRNKMTIRCQRIPVANPPTV